MNNIPPKICSYSCVYCQLGSALHQELERKAFYPISEIVSQVSDRVMKVHEKRENIDYLTFVPDGEPTLDVNLGREIEALKSLGPKIAVITNSSLLWRKDVREELMNADWISLKVDSVSETVWRRINRPYQSLKLDMILEGVREFSRLFKGELTTETMLVEGGNDGEEAIRSVAEFLTEIEPDLSYVAVPTRPPAEQWVRPPAENIVNAAYQIFKERLPNVELLTGYEGNEFVSAANIEDDLLAITAVHPMRRDGVERLLSSANAGWEVVDKLIKENELKEVEYQGAKYFLRSHLQTRA